jgi:nucleotide-binding universal stress UspA family protein
MPVGKILAVVTGGPRDSAVLCHAIEAARPFNAHVVAFFVRPDLTEAIAFFNDGVSGVVVDEVVKASRDAADEAGRRIEQAIASVCSRSGVQIVAAPHRSNAVTLSFRQAQGNLSDQLTEAARLADVIVFGPLHDGDKAGLADAFVQVLVETDRPVLLAPDRMPEGFARHIAIGWDGKTAASQAVSAAIPYLQRAERVEILSVQRASANPQPTEALREYLGLHNIAAGERVIVRSNKSTGEVLLEAALASGADLLVVGGYGHGRIRESLIGGVTRHVITHAKLAVFMVH